MKGDFIMEQVKVAYLGHACFALESDGYRAVIDPYKDGMVDGLPALYVEANAVYGSHGHADHNWFDAVTIVGTDKAAPYALSEFETPHDDQGGKLRGMNLVRIFDFHGLRVAHLGDLGDFPEENVLAALKGVDCLLIPVGGTYTIDPEMAKKVVDAVNPRVCVPMHYRTDCTGFDVLAHLKDFIKYYPETRECDNSFLLTKETPKQILVINYKP